MTSQMAILFLCSLALPAGAMVAGTPGPTARRHGYYPPTRTSTPTPSPSPTLVPERAACLGDRNGDSRVAIDELILAVGIALETVPLSAFPALDYDHSQRVEIDELMLAVNNALDDCPADLVISSIRPYYSSGEPGCNPHRIFVCIVNRGADVWHDFTAIVRGEVDEMGFRFSPGLAAGQEACLTFLPWQLGRPIIGGGELPEFTVMVDTLGEVTESDEDNNVQSVVVTPNGVCTPTPTPSGELRIEPPGLTVACEAEFDITFTNTSASEPLVIHSVSFHHGYSQGFYSTGFSVLTADDETGHGGDQVVNGPIVLASGETFIIPVRYSAGGTNSRLHMSPATSAGNLQNDQLIYYGFGCPSPTPFGQ